MPYNTREKLYKAQKEYRIKVREKILDFLSKKKCIDCGENDPIVLDFDHIDRDKKFKSVSQMLCGHYSFETILKEIEKCEVRCANCHRRKTYLQFKCFGKGKPS
jgi:hypothetical protein